jgi:iron complex outermembrane receptor protein
VVPFTDAFGRTTQETINVNAGVSQIYGFELETIWMPEQVPGLTLSLNSGYMNHEYDEFFLPGRGDLSDNDVPWSPEWRYMATISYDQSTAYGTFTYNLSANYQDEAEMSVFNSPLTQMEERTLVDANITWWEPEERYYLSLWGKNLTDERHRIGANSVAGLWNFTMYGRPRSYGLEAGVTF